MESASMSDEVAAIIRKAMTDRATYAAMAERENKVWGSILPNREREEAMVADLEASKDLVAGRNFPLVEEVLSGLNLSFDFGLSLGCGAGRLERSLVSEGICKSMHGVDISEAAINAARSEAEAAHLPITYEVADLNFLELEPRKYEFIAAQTSLHHVLHLEHVIYQAWRGLAPGGAFWAMDFIGESMGQYHPKRLQILNDILAIIPEKMRDNKVIKRRIDSVKRPIPGRLISPFEKIRSGEIVEILMRLFEPEYRCEGVTIIDLLTPAGSRVAFAENEDTRALFELIMYVDKLLMTEGVLAPVGGQYLLRPKDLGDATFDELFPDVPRYEDAPAAPLEAGPD